ncbi:MAG: hypothetical protein V4440_09685 [Pseudomonadota bacterium]
MVSLTKAPSIIVSEKNTVAIAADGDTSEPLVCAGNTFLGVIVPQDWTTANITFEGSLDGLNFYPVLDMAGGAVTITFTVDTAYYSVLPVYFAGLLAIKFVSSVPQVDDVVLTAALRPI